MRLQLNGEPFDLPDDRSWTVLGFIELLGIESGRVAVERNREIVRRADHIDTPVEEGDAIEIVTFVGGG